MERAQKRMESADRMIDSLVRLPAPEAVCALIAAAPRHEARPLGLSKVSATMLAEARAALAWRKGR